VTLIGQDVFRHAYVNAMKPSLAVPICVLACGALVTMLLQTSGGARGEARAPERAETGVAVAGE
jgi:hypothetical protein